MAVSTGTWSQEVFPRFGDLPRLRGGQLRINLNLFSSMAKGLPWVCAHIIMVWFESGFLLTALVLEVQLALLR